MRLNLFEEYFIYNMIDLPEIFNGLIKENDNKKCKHL